VQQRPEQLAELGAVTLCYDELGDPDAPAMLLVMGMGFQLVHWPEELCRRLTAEGFRVIRFDNRDSGRSTHLPGQRYTIEELADDALGLLDALGVESAHVVGASMGGMVAQLMAIRAPRRVLSLASLMSTTGRRGVGRTSLRLLRHLFAARPRTVDEAVERRVKVLLSMASPGFEVDVEEVRRVNTLAFARDPDSRGGRHRQLRAVRRATDRTEALNGLRVPTVVIHGTHDLMCHPSGGRATAEAIPGARLCLVDGLGHDLPRGAWPRLVEEIVGNARRAEEGLQ
jgi:pimeloyl-ACP methyl ester carboxylesterase